MFYSSISALLILLGIFISILAARMLLRSGWFFGWLRGMLGFLLLIIAVLFALGAVDFFSYKAIISEKHIATLDFTKVAEQEYTASLVSEDGIEYQFVLYGDQWQIDARIIKWPNSFAALGVRPGYRLERISGRYYSWQQELDRPRSVYPIDHRQFGLDLWHWAQQLELNDIGIDASYGSATYLPMADGAQYEVSLTRTGLIARPFNQTAENAINRWLQ